MRIKLRTLVLGTDAQDIYPTISLCHLWHPILVNTREILLTNDVSYRYNKSSLYHQLLNSVKLGSSFTSLEVERYDWRWVGQLESYTSLEVERYDWRWVRQLESYVVMIVHNFTSCTVQVLIFGNLLFRFIFCLINLICLFFYFFKLFFFWGSCFVEIWMNTFLFSNINGADLFSLYLFLLFCYLLIQLLILIDE